MDYFQSINGVKTLLNTSISSLKITNKDKLKYANKEKESYARGIINLFENSETDHAEDVWFQIYRLDGELYLKTHKNKFHHHPKYNFDILNGKIDENPQIAFVIKLVENMLRLNLDFLPLYAQKDNESNILYSKGQ